MVIGNNIRKASVLVIENDHLDMLVIKVLLERYFNLYMVTNGEEALVAANEFDFDVVLADINLGDPNMDGVKIMRKLRENENTCNLKIIAVTAYAENVDYYLDSGFNSVLTKPVIKEEIFDILQGSVSENYKFLEIGLKKKQNS